MIRLPLIAAALLVPATIGLAIIATTPHQEPPVMAASPVTAAKTVLPNRVESAVNKQRIEQGVQPLVSNERLRAAACAKAKHMIERDYWSHYSPEGLEPWSFVKLAGYEYRSAGENLARGYSDASETAQAWMDSPSHRKNMLNTEFKDQGICVREGTLGGEQTYVIVQMLGVRG